MSNSISPADFAAGAAPAASSLGQFGLNVAGDQISQKTQAKYYKENQDYLLATQMKAARNSYQSAVASLGEAGLNPAIAANSSGMSVGSAPHPTPSGHSVDAPNPEFALTGSKSSLMKKQEEQIDSGIELNKSGIDKNIADAGKATEEAEYYNQLAGQLMRSNRDSDEKRFFFSELSMEYLGALRQQAEDSNDKNRVKVIDGLLDFKKSNPDLYFPPALVDAFSLINSGTAENQEHYAKIINDKLREMVAAGQLQNSAELNALIHAPTREATAMWKQIAATSKNIELLGQQKSINEADIRKIEAEIIELGKSAERMDAETKKAYSSDVTRMLKDGDYLGAGLELFKTVGNPLTYVWLFGKLGGKMNGKSPAAPAAPAAPTSVSKPVVLPVKGTRDPYAPTAKTGETLKAEDFQKRVSEPFKERIEINKARGDFNRFYKKYKREHDH